MPDEEKDEEYPLSVQGSRKKPLLKSSRDISINMLNKEDKDNKSS
jgi:hypothetical protein